jgi:hypothetical protein
MPNEIRNSIEDVTEVIGITHEGGIVSSSICENNRPFESARTVGRPDMRMVNAARSSSAFRPSRKLFPRVPRAGHLPHDEGG